MLDPIPDVDARAFGIAPGLPDTAFDHDGLLTKRVVRAAALAELRPRPGEVLWDLGAASGSVGIEWARCGGSRPAARAYGVERDPVRAARARRNAARLTLPGQVVICEGDAEALLDELPPPDAVFVGGGATAALLDRCRAALRPGGRLVVHAVTVETEVVLLAAYESHGGELTRLAVETVQPLGNRRGWTPQRAVVQWSLRVHGSAPQSEGSGHRAH